MTDAQAARAAAETSGSANGSEPEEELAELDAAAVEALAAERDSYKDQLLRSVAEFTNYRRRIEQDLATVRTQANKGLLLQLLDVMDDFGRALAAIPEEEGQSGWVTGTTMIEKKLQAVLERAGVTPLEALGRPFDPALHEAVASDPGSDGSTVVEVYRQGYRLGDGLLRPAMVRVGSKPVA